MSSLLEVRDLRMHFPVKGGLFSRTTTWCKSVDGVSLDVGFYYMANAGGRLVGCLLSGVLYQAAGLPGCLWGAFAFAVAAAVVALKLPREALHAEKLAAASVRADGD